MYAYLSSSILLTQDGDADDDDLISHHMQSNNVALTNGNCIVFCYCIVLFFVKKSIQKFHASCTRFEFLFFWYSIPHNDVYLRWVPAHERADCQAKWEGAMADPCPFCGVEVRLTVWYRNGRLQKSNCRRTIASEKIH